MISKFTVRSGGKAYSISQMSNPPDPKQDIWFENHEDEGMSMSSKNLFDILDRAFKEEF